MHAIRIEMLQRMPIFGALREDTLDFLLGQARSRQLRAGETFFVEGDLAQSLYVLERGRASVVKGWKGRRFLLHRLHAGDCFGEMALLDLMPRSATVLADEDCSALELRSEDLLRLYERDLEQFALVQMNLGRELSRRLRETDERLFQLQVERRPPPPATEWADSRV